MSVPGGPVERAGWYGVRCLIRFAEGSGQHYEESVTVWRAVSLDEAIGKAEAAAREYADVCAGEQLRFAQAFFIGDAETIEEGVEVFSLMRASALEPDDYLTRFFDTGDERQGQIDDQSRPRRR